MANTRFSVFNQLIHGFISRAIKSSRQDKRRPAPTLVNKSLFSESRIRGHASPHNGYTLLELMITMTLLATLLTIAAPSFAAMTANTKVKTTAKSMLHSLAVARTNALSETATTLVCQLDPDDRDQCVTKPKARADWSAGWQVFVDRNDNARLDTEDLIVSRVISPNNAAIVFNQNGRLRFFSNGSARSAGFYVCSENTEQVRHIKILHSGRTRVISKVSKQAQSICKNALQNSSTT